MKSGLNKDLAVQMSLLEEIILKNDVLKEVLRLTPELKLPNWYIGAGCVAQTVWNYFHEFPLANGIKDYDLVYCDTSDITSAGQGFHITQGKELFKNLGVPVEIVNEARVHLWYEEEFGSKVDPYHSTEEAINEWPTTATGIGVTYDQDKVFCVYAPYGLNDLWSLTVRPNKRKITEDIYLSKVTRWKGVWPNLQIIPWNS